jgi:MarR family transcriptional regulator for hemolysin
MQRLRNFGFLVKDVYRLYVRYFEQCAVQLGMTLAQCKVLVILSRNEGTTQARLAELSDTDPMTLVRILDRMEKDAWLERRSDPKDRRAHRLVLKPASDPVLAEVMRIADSARAQVLAGLSSDDQTQLMELLERIQANLVALVPSSPDSPRQSADSPAVKHSQRVRASRVWRASPPRGRKTSR